MQVKYAQLALNCATLSTKNSVQKCVACLYHHVVHDYSLLLSCLQ